MVSREVPCAIRRSVPCSSTKASESPTERPTWIAWPPAVSMPPGRAGRRNDNDSSAVVYGVAGGSSVSTEQPKAMSARIASVPPVISPFEAPSHPEAGIWASAVPEPNPVGRAPVRWDRGGRGVSPRRQVSSLWRPESAISLRSG